MGHKGKQIEKNGIKTYKLILTLNPDNNNVLIKIQ